MSPLFDRRFSGPELLQNFPYEINCLTPSQAVNLTLMHDNNPQHDQQSPNPTTRKNVPSVLKK